MRLPTSAAENDELHEPNKKQDRRMSRATGPEEEEGGAPGAVFGLETAAS